MSDVMLIQGTALKLPLKDGCVQMICTSVPYWQQRSYLNADDPLKAHELGLEATVDEYIANMVTVFREVFRVLRDDGTCWINCGDKMVNGQLLGLPWRLAFALQADGWRLRSEIIWHKINPMPESVKDSHFSRHRITIQEYENLSNLSRTHCRNDDGATDVQGLPESQISSREAPVSREREGEGNGTGTGRACRREREAETTQSINTRSIEQSQVRSNPEGESDTAETGTNIFPQRQGEEKGCGTSSTDKEHSNADTSETGSRGSLSSHIQVCGEETTGLCEATICDCPRAHCHSRGLVGAGTEKQEPLLLLQKETRLDDGSCHSSEQGRETRQREHRSSLPELQLSEKGPLDSSDLIDCPGCPKCKKHNGFILRHGAGRPTHAHEQIFLFAKQPRYFIDMEAIREPNEGDGRKRGHQTLTPKVALDRTTGVRNNSSWYAGKVYDVTPDNHRHARDVWAFCSEGFAGSHFATFPTALVSRCILAGSSTRCCPQCHTPYQRQVERTATPAISHKGSRFDMGKMVPGKGRAQPGERFLSQTTGFAPFCSCITYALADRCCDTQLMDWLTTPVPSLVLDPFSGSGTVPLVARALGRHGAGIELSWDYLKLSRERLGLQALKEWEEGSEVKPTSFEGLPLFTAPGESA